MFDSESTAGIETAANTVGTSDRKLDLLRHEDLKSEALEESNTTAATPAELKERKVLALQTSLEKSFFSIGKCSMTVQMQRGSVSADAGFVLPSMPEPTDSESRDWSECGWCNSCVVDSANISWNATSLAPITIRKRMTAKGEVATNYTDRENIEKRRGGCCA